MRGIELETSAYLAVSARPDTMPSAPGTSPLHLQACRAMKPPSRPRNLAILCNSEDGPWLVLLLQHLRIFQDRGAVTVWTPAQILPGMRRRDALLAALQGADAILLFVSPRFLAEDFAPSGELHGPILAAAARGTPVSWIPISASAAAATEVAAFDPRFVVGDRRTEHGQQPLPRVRRGRGREGHDDWQVHGQRHVTAAVTHPMPDVAPASRHRTDPTSPATETQAKSGWTSARRRGRRRIATPRATAADSGRSRRGREYGPAGMLRDREVHLRVLQRRGMHGRLGRGPD